MQPLRLEVPRAPRRGRGVLPIGMRDANSRDGSGANRPCLVDCRTAMRGVRLPLSSIMPVPKRDIMLEVNMKARRAQHHLEALNVEIKQWLASPNLLTIREYAKFEEGLHVFRIDISRVPELIPLLVGDFVCCLRSSLDQLAWGLAHLDTKRIFTEREERNISFLIFKQRSNTYDDRRTLFPPAVATIFDGLQPYLRGNAYKDDLLWQLDELWRMDKHRMIAANCTVLTVALPGPPSEWERFIRRFDYHLEVHFPLVPYMTSKVHFKPEVSVDMLFGEYMGEFEVSPARLGEINHFVRNDVIPRFAGFFP